MAAEQSVVALAILGVSFIWYSNELAKRGAMMWAQVFQMFFFFFILINLTVMTQLFRADAFFDLEDLTMAGLFFVVQTLVWCIVLIWIFSFIFEIIKGIQNPKMEKPKKIGGNEYGPQ